MELELSGQSSDLFQRIVELAALGDILISEHGYDELADDGIEVRDILWKLAEGRVVEVYPEFHKGPCVLVLQEDRFGQPVHVLWGIPAGAVSPAVVITAYRPDPARWSEDFLRRNR